MDRLRELEDCRTLLVELDKHGLLGMPTGEVKADPDELDSDALLAELEGIESAGDITELRHVESTDERRAAEEIANREKCKDFAIFKPLFEQVSADLDAGIRATRPFELKAEIRPGAFFIVGGQIAYVAEK